MLLVQAGSMFPGQLGWYGSAPGFLPSGLPGLLPGAYAPGGGSQPRLEASGEQPETRAALIVHSGGRTPVAAIAEKRRAKRGAMEARSTFFTPRAQPYSLSLWRLGRRSWAGGRAVRPLARPGRLGYRALSVR